MNKYSEQITTCGISGQLKKLAIRYEIDPVVVYPHSFRHRFAKSFLDRCNDIAFLAFFCDMENGQETVQERSYANLTAKVSNEYVKEFHGDCPVLKVLKFEPAEAPEDDLLYMNN